MKIEIFQKIQINTRAMCDQSTTYDPKPHFGKLNKTK